MHVITVSNPYFELSGKPVVLEINIDGEKQGHMEIRKGGIRWWPKDKVKGRKIRWEKFVEVMDEIYDRRL